MVRGDAAQPRCSALGSALEVREVTEEPTSFADALALLARDRTHGATWLAARAALAVAMAVAEERRAADPLAVARRAARRVAALRPSMVALGNAAAELCQRLAAAADPRAAAVQLAAELADELAQAADALATQARPLAQGVVLTHSLSGSVLAVLRVAQPASVIVTESRPLCEGRATATALAAAGLPVVLITEAQVAVHVREAVCAILGADALLPDGSCVNKVGSTLVALAAREAGRPVYVASDLLKSCAAPPPDEEDPPGQVWEAPPAGIVVRNIVFERVPPHLITAYVTPDGVRTPAELGALVAARVARWAWVR